MINNYIHKKSKNKSQKQKHILINTYNPLTSHLYFKISYNYIKRFVICYKENQELLQNMEDQSLY